MNAYRFGPDSTVKIEPMKPVKFAKTPFVQSKDANVMVCDVIAHVHRMTPKEVQRLRDMGWQFDIGGE